MKFMNGFKTIVGLIGTVVLVVAPSISADTVAMVGSQVYGIAQGIFGLLGVLGLIHKAEKAKP